MNVHGVTQPAKPHDRQSQFPRNDSMRTEACSVAEQPGSDVGSIVKVAHFCSCKNSACRIAVTGTHDAIAKVAEARAVSRRSLQRSAQIDCFRPQLSKKDSCILKG
nr:hypothetical protein CFP56_43816 [Quercus suber]